MAATQVPTTTATAQIDAAVEALAERKSLWANLPVEEKVALLDRVRRDLATIAERWAGLAADAKGVPRDSAAAGEEWTTFSVLIRNVEILRRSLADILRRGKPALPGRPRRVGTDQIAVPVFPQNLYDRLIYPGVKAEVWLEPGIGEDELAREQAAAYHQPGRAGRVVLVLSGGNVSILGPSDALDKLFCEGNVVAFKTHPVVAHLAPLLEEGFRALIEGGWLRIIYGGAEEGRYLAHHPLVDEIHLTGSDRTYDAIVFGPGEEGRRRKASGDRLISKRFTCELGNVSPVIIVPGRWSDAELSYQAEHVASMLMMNAGFFCLTTRMIVTHAAWPQRERFLDAMRRVLADAPLRPAYYPGAHGIFDRFTAAHPEAERFGGGDDVRLPWTLVAGLDPARTDDPCFTTEPFCSLFSETPIEAPSVPEFLDRAVSFANETLWGTLTATLIVSPAAERDPAVATAVERAVAALRYGTVGVNLWGIYNFVTLTGSWGAFPGHPPQDIQSGHGTVHNLLMLPDPQKTVIRGPFIMRPKPLHFPSHRRVLAVGRAMTRFEAHRSPLAYLRVALPALRG